MKEIYNKEYYDNYDINLGKVNYKNCEELKQVLKSAAKNIVDDLNPKTVLDVGCATGHLVEALRDLGVEAYGIDISKYAIENVREDIKPYCAVCSCAESLPKNFPKKYDLVFSNEVIEHLYEEDTEKAINNICTMSDLILLGTTSSDFEDKTHLNVRQREHWAKMLAKNGMFNRLDYSAAYLSKDMHLYYRSDNIPRVIEDYERHLRIAGKYKNENAQLEKRLASYAQELSIMGKVKDDYKNLEKTYQKLMGYTAQVEDQRDAYAQVANSTVWKLTKPFRILLNLLNKFLRKFKLVGKGIKSIFKIGPKATWRKFKNRTNAISSYKAYMKSHKMRHDELETQRQTEFKKNIKISIIVPLYNTPEKFLHELIQSVQFQTYKNFEICLADGSTNEGAAVETICKRYAELDTRIVYKKLEKNEGIAGNTNAALKMAQGDFIFLLDHDDLIPQNALFECMKAIEEQGADFIYSDEMVFEDTVDNVQLIHFKPDFSPDTLRGHNYICHLCAFSKELQNKVGFFSNQHDGSQDYDMILRLTDEAKKIVHIPKVLYYWRCHAGSVASDVMVKPYCMDSAKKAIADHLERKGLKGKVVDSSILSTYKVEYEIEGEPLISILIPSKDHIEDLEVCISSILTTSTYKNFEIIVIENNSTEPKTFDYYNAITLRDNRIKVVYYEGDFNYSSINNFGAKSAKGDYFLLLNNDVKIITPKWLEEMLMYAQREDVGATGSLLYYPDDTVQHAGLIMGIGKQAAHAHRHAVKGSGGYIHRLSIAQNLSGVTAACMMVKRKVFEELGGLDEDFKVAYNDVDFCLRIRQAGYLIVFTPYAELYHYESKSRGYEDTPEKKARFEREAKLLRKRWGEVIDKGDPYYNPGLTLDREDFTLKADS